MFLQVGYQKNLQLAYIDKLLTDIHREFRDKYKDVLEAGSLQSCDFDEDFNRLLKELETEFKNKKMVMRSFEETKKAQKIRENKGELSAPVKKSVKKVKNKNNETEENKENVPGWLNEVFEYCHVLLSLLLLLLSNANPLDLWKENYLLPYSFLSLNCWYLLCME